MAIYRCTEIVNTSIILSNNSGGEVDAMSFFYIVQRFMNLLSCHAYIIYFKVLHTVI